MGAMNTFDLSCFLTNKILFLIVLLCAIQIYSQNDLFEEEKVTSEDSPVLSDEEKKILRFWGKTLFREGISSSDRADNAVLVYYQLSRLKAPSELSSEEKAEENILERFALGYIGELPTAIASALSHFHFFEKKPKLHKSPNVFLLHGPPGCGKSYLVEHMAHVLQIPLLSCSAGSFIDKYAGESSKKIRKFFGLIKKCDKPFIIFIDEIDAIALNRKSFNGGGEYRSALTDLLIEIQNITFQKNVMLFIATNTLAQLDDAIVSRFKGQIIEVKNISTKDEYVAFYKKSLKDNGFTDAKEIEYRAEYLYNKIHKSGSLPADTSMRELSKIVPLVLNFFYDQKCLYNKSVEPDSAIKIAIEALKEKGSRDYFEWCFYAVFGIIGIDVLRKILYPQPILSQKS